MKSFCKQLCLKKKKIEKELECFLWPWENDSLMTLGKQHLKSRNISLFSWPLFSKLLSFLCHTCIHFQSVKCKSTNPIAGSCPPSRSSADWEQELISSSPLNHNWLRMLRSLLLPKYHLGMISICCIILQGSPVPAKWGAALLNPNYAVFNVSL